MIRSFLAALLLLLLTGCPMPRGRSCLGFLERCGEKHSCVQYFDQTGLEASCEVRCQSDAQCPKGEWCRLPPEGQNVPVNVCVKKRWEEG